MAEITWPQPLTIGEITAKRGEEISQAIKEGRERDAANVEANKKRLKEEFSYSDAQLLKMTPWQIADEVRKLDRAPHAANTTSFKQGYRDPYEKEKQQLAQKMIEAEQNVKDLQGARAVTDRVPLVRTWSASAEARNQERLGNKEAALEAKVRAASGAIGDVVDLGFFAVDPLSTGTMLLGSNVGEHYGGETGSVVGGLVGAGVPTLTRAGYRMLENTVAKSAPNLYASMNSSPARPNELSFFDFANYKKQSDDSYTFLLPGYKSFKVVPTEHGSTFTLYNRDLNLGGTKEWRPLAHEVPYYEILETLQPYKDQFDWAATNFQKLALRDYKKIPKAELNSAGQWTNYQELQQETPQWAKDYLHNLWELERSGYYQTPEFAERYLDLGGTDINKVISDTYGINTPIIYKHVPANGGVAFSTEGNRPWGINIVSAAGDIDSSAAHEIAHLLYGNNRNEIAVINNKFIQEQGGLIANTTEAFKSLSPEEQQYVGDPNEFHSFIVEGVRKMIKEHKSAEEVLDGNLMAMRQLKAFYNRDFLIKCLNNMCTIGGIGLGIYGSTQ